MPLARGSGVVTRPSEERCTSQNVDLGRTDGQALDRTKTIKYDELVGERLGRDRVFQMCEIIKFGCTLHRLMGSITDHWHATTRVSDVRFRSQLT